MEIKVMAHKDNYDSTEMRIILTPTEQDSLIWLEIGLEKVSVNTEDFLRAVSVFMPKLKEF